MVGKLKHGKKKVMLSTCFACDEVLPWIPYRYRSRQLSERPPSFQLLYGVSHRLASTDPPALVSRTDSDPVNLELLALENGRVVQACSSSKVSTPTSHSFRFGDTALICQWSPFQLRIEMPAFVSTC